MLIDQGVHGSRLPSKAAVRGGLEWRPLALETPLALSDPQGVAPSQVSCASRTSCTVIGSLLSGRGTAAFVVHHVGTSWSIQALARPPGTTNPSDANAVSLNGISCPSSGVCSAVGWYADHADHEVTLVEDSHRGGGQCSAPPTPRSPFPVGSSPCRAHRYAGASRSRPTRLTIVARRRSGTIVHGRPHPPRPSRHPRCHASQTSPARRLDRRSTRSVCSSRSLRPGTRMRGKQVEQI